MSELQQPKEESFLRMDGLIDWHVSWQWMVEHPDVFKQIQNARIHWTDTIDARLLPFGDTFRYRSYGLVRFEVEEPNEDYAILTFQGRDLRDSCQQCGAEENLITRTTTGSICRDCQPVLYSFKYQSPEGRLVEKGRFTSLAACLALAESLVPPTEHVIVLRHGPVGGKYGRVERVDYDFDAHNRLVPSHTLRGRVEIDSHYAD